MIFAMNSRRSDLIPSILMNSLQNEISKKRFSFAAKILLVLITEYNYQDEFFKFINEGAFRA